MGEREGVATNFREFNDAELAKLSDEDVIAYVVRARATGRDDAAALAVQILAFAHEQRLLGWFYTQIGSKGRQVVEELTEITLASAMGSAASFEGEALPSFRAWLFRIARYRRADYFRKKRVDEEPFATDYGDEEQEREFGAGDPLGAIDDADVFNQAFEELNKDSHKLVVMLGLLYGFAHKDVAERVNRQFGEDSDDPMTENNVSKILSRFNKRLDQLMDEAENPQPPDDDD